jgi:glycosyltransferase involved in cell wall biosynthesis
MPESESGMAAVDGVSVALFASAYAPHVGGVEEHVRHLARELKSRGYRPFVVTILWPRDLPHHEWIEGIEVLRFPMITPRSDLRTSLKFQLSRVKTLQKIVGALKERRADIVHIQCASSNAMYAMWSADQLGLPLVYSTHGERSLFRSGPFLDSQWMERGLKQVARRADHLSACSRSTLRELQSFAGIETDKATSVIYNGVEEGEWSGVSPHQNERPYVLSLGRFVAKKGFDVLLRAWSEAKINDFDLILAGDGEENARLRELAAQLKLSNLHFFGKANREQVASLFLGCQFFVLPSLLEPQGIVLLEAMRAGKAVVASDVDGVPETVVDGETGHLVPPGDVSALADALQKMSASPSVRTRLGAAGQIRSRDFTWSRAAGQVDQIYRQILKSGSQ